MGGFLATAMVGAELRDRGTLGVFTEQLPQTEDTGPCKRGETGLGVLPGAMEATCGDRFPLLVVLGHLALPQEWSVRPSHTHTQRATALVSGTSAARTQAGPPRYSRGQSCCCSCAGRWSSEEPLGQRHSQIHGAHRARPQA